jgi:hypothetical protein
MIYDPWIPVDLIITAACRVAQSQALLRIAKYGLASKAIDWVTNCAHSHYSLMWIYDLNSHCATTLLCDRSSWSSPFCWTTIVHSSSWWRRSHQSDSLMAWHVPCTIALWLWNIWFSPSLQSTRGICMTHKLLYLSSNWNSTTHAVSCLPFAERQKHS